MTTLLRTEWLKMRKYNAFWWILGITALSYPGVNFIFYQAYKDLTNNPTQLGQYAKMGLGDPFSFPEVWHTAAFSSSIFVFIPAVIIIMFISNEYSFRTHRQNIIDGWSRNQFISSKLMDVLIITLIITLLYIIFCLVCGFANPTAIHNNAWSKSYYIGLFALQTFAQLSLAFLVGFLIRKAFLALGVFLFYFVILENIFIGIMYRYDISFRDYLPVEISDKLIPPPAFFGSINPDRYQKALDQVNLHILLTILLTAVVWGICYRINNRRDLK